MPNDVFHHHHSPVYDHAEIQGAQGEQVRGNVPQVQADGGEEQGEWDRQGDNDCSANVAQKDEQDDHYQNHSFGEIMQHGVRRVVHKIVAVEVGDNLHPRRQDVIVEAIDHGVERFQHGRGVRSLPEEHNSFHYIVVIFDYPVGAMDGLADLSQSNLRSLRN